MQWQSHKDLGAPLLCNMLGNEFPNLRKGQHEKKRYTRVESRDGERHYVWEKQATKPKKSLSKEEVERISKKDATNPSVHGSSYSLLVSLCWAATQPRAILTPIVQVARVATKQARQTTNSDINSKGLLK